MPAVCRLLRDSSCSPGVLATAAVLLATWNLTAAAQEAPNRLPVRPEAELFAFEGSPPVWLSAGASRERDPIETDRHDFTQSPRTVTRGTLQIESGYTYFYRDYDDEIEQSHTLPETVIRYGLTDDIEFRVRMNYVSQFRDGEEELDDREGAEDIRWGFKFQISEPCGWQPESALRVISTIPSGGDDFSTDRVELGVDYVYAWDISERINLAGSTGFATNAAGEYSLGGQLEGEQQNFVAIAQSAALGFELTEQTELYLEWYTLWTNGLRDEQVLTFVNIGLDYLLTDDLVIDFRIGKGLSDEADDLFAGAGGGIRF